MSKLRGSLFTITAPSGTGKTTVVKKLLEQVDLKLSISHTTRESRENERNGVDYFFISLEDFKVLIEGDQFIEHAKVYGNYYGTSKQWLLDQINMGNNILLEIDEQGAGEIKQVFPNAISIFILPPSYSDLEERLLQRKESPKNIKHRLSRAKDEIKQVINFDYVVFNKDLKQCLSDLVTIVNSAKHRSIFIDYPALAEKWDL